ncbi:unnamed protein product [Prunus armeniaca]
MNPALPNPTSPTPQPPLTPIFNLSTSTHRHLTTPSRSHHDPHPLSLSQNHDNYHPKATKMKTYEWGASLGLKLLLYARDQGGWGRGAVLRMGEAEMWVVVIREVEMEVEVVRWGMSLSVDQNDTGEIAE